VIRVTESRLNEADFRVTMARTSLGSKNYEYLRRISSGIYNE
jgi:hypothetical protein